MWRSILLKDGNVSQTLDSISDWLLQRLWNDFTINIPLSLSNWLHSFSEAQMISPWIKSSTRQLWEDCWQLSVKITQEQSRYKDQCPQLLNQDLLKQLNNLRVSPTTLQKENNLQVSQWQNPTLKLLERILMEVTMKMMMTDLTLDLFWVSLFP